MHKAHVTNILLISLCHSYFIAKTVGQRRQIPSLIPGLDEDRRSTTNKRVESDSFPLVTTVYRRTHSWHLTSTSFDSSLKQEMLCVHLLTTEMSEYNKMD